MSGMMIYKMSDEKHTLPPVEVTGRFVIVSEQWDEGRAWHVVDRVGAPYDQSSQEYWLTTSGEVISDGGVSATVLIKQEATWLLDCDGGPGWYVMTQYESQGETAKACVEHCRLLREHEDKIPVANNDDKE